MKCSVLFALGAISCMAFAGSKFADPFKDPSNKIEISCSVDHAFPQEIHIHKSKDPRALSLGKTEKFLADGIVIIGDWATSDIKVENRIFPERTYTLSIAQWAKKQFPILGYKHSYQCLVISNL